MKTCDNGYCEYRALSGNLPGCTYEGYCDFQRPRDSRKDWQTISWNNMPSVAICPICNLPYIWCKGHTSAVDKKDGTV